MLTEEPSLPNAWLKSLEKEVTKLELLVPSTKIRLILTFTKYPVMSCPMPKHRRKIVHFFPEADLWHLYQGIDYLQRGAFYLAHHAYCPVMPVVHLFKSRTIFGKQLSKNITVIRSNYSTTTFCNVFDPLLLMLNKYRPGGRSEMSIDNRWLFINVNFLSKIPLCE